MITLTGVVSICITLGIHTLNGTENFNEKSFYTGKYKTKKFSKHTQKQDKNVKEYVLKEFRKMLRKEIENGNKESLCILIQKFINPHKLPQEERMFRTLFLDDNTKLKLLAMLSV